MEITKKMAAAISAVTTYLKTEEEMLAMQAAAAVSAPSPGLQMWGTSARRDMMSLRCMMQLRTFHGANLRAR
ncbi:MAG TPA: hypothetical protein PKV75_09670 [Desulfobacterales bacterium]|nr:hypothetical protein [Desulfobacterales bacterium]